MCRITGFWDFKFQGEYDNIRVLQEMRDSLAHGGPDDAGSWISEDGIHVANRRLAILDLSPAGHQPIEDENYVISYNGEIYNFKEIKEILMKKGYKFKSNSDTEVILKAWKEWGENCLSLFRGMWAFALWDKKNKVLILCRDRIGVKPLFWYYKDNLFMFASELKAFHKHPKFKKELNEIGLSLFLQYGYIPAPYSIFKYTYKLQPGHILKIDSTGKTGIKKYWDVSDFFIKGILEKNNWLKKHEEEVVEEFENILKESFLLRMVSDVPVGVFFSGGLDSTILVTLLSQQLSMPLKTFTIGFYEKQYNEALFAAKLAEYLGTEHTEMYCTPKEAFEIIPYIPNLYDEPNGDSSIIPTLLVSKLARQYVKVSLSADGGDEQLCGYRKYWFLKNINFLSKIPFVSDIIKFGLLIFTPEIAFKIYEVFKEYLPGWQNFYDKYKKLKLIWKMKDDLKKHDIIVRAFLDDDLDKLGIVKTSDLNLVAEEIKNADVDIITKTMWHDIKTELADDILVKVDRATMSVGLEGREPFLDNKIVEYTAQMPLRFKYRKGKSKFILRKILYKYVPPKLIERPKMGFSIPLYEWFRNNLSQMYKEYLDSEKIKNDGIFNVNMVSDLLDKYFSGKGISKEKLWYIFIFQLWKEKWL